MAKIENRSRSDINKKLMTYLGKLWVAWSGEMPSFRPIKNPFAWIGLSVRLMGALSAHFGVNLLVFGLESRYLIIRSPSSDSSE